MSKRTDDYLRWVLAQEFLLQARKIDFVDATWATFLHEYGSNYPFEIGDVVFVKDVASGWYLETVEVVKVSDDFEIFSVVDNGGTRLSYHHSHLTLKQLPDDRS